MFQVEKGVDYKLPLVHHYFVSNEKDQLVLVQLIEVVGQNQYQRELVLLGLVKLRAVVQV